MTTATDIKADVRRVSEYIANYRKTAPDAAVGTATAQDVDLLAKAVFISLSGAEMTAGQAFDAIKGIIEIAVQVGARTENRQPSARPGMGARKARGE